MKSVIKIFVSITLFFVATLSAAQSFEFINFVNKTSANFTGWVPPTHHARVGYVATPMAVLQPTTNATGQQGLLLLLDRDAFRNHIIYSGYCNQISDNCAFMLDVDAVNGKSTVKVLQVYPKNKLNVAVSGNTVTINLAQ